jgi:hypothetical protein
MREPQLALRIGRATGANQEPHADGRLLVVQDHHDLQAVRKRLHVVGRKLDVARGQRAGRLL